MATRLRSRCLLDSNSFKGLQLLREMYDTALRHLSMQLASHHVVTLAPLQLLIEPVSGHRVPLGSPVTWLPLPQPASWNLKLYGSLSNTAGIACLVAGRLAPVCGVLSELGKVPTGVPIQPEPTS